MKYNFISDATRKNHSGFIAQEIEAIGIPFYGLNKPASKDDYYTLAYSEFVVPLVNAVKELKQENDKLNVTLAELKTSHDDLRTRLEKLEAKVK